MWIGQLQLGRNSSAEEDKSISTIIVETLTPLAGLFSSLGLRMLNHVTCAYPDQSLALAFGNFVETTSSPTSIPAPTTKTPTPKPTTKTPTTAPTPTTKPTPTKSGATVLVFRLSQTILAIGLVLMGKLVKGTHAFNALIYSHC